jgi:hypothetical protein
MRKRILILVVAVGFVGWFLIYATAHGQAERKSRLIAAQSILRQACEEYVKTGDLPAKNGSWKIMAFTNEVLISGRRIRMVAATTLPNGDPSWGFFAIAATGELVWLRADRKAVLVSAPNYAVPFWSDGY